MVHAREDYNRIQDPALRDPSLLGDGSTPIGEDEPVFLLRAQDKLFVRMLQHYMQELLFEYGDSGLNVKEDGGAYDLVEAHIVTAIKWQERNGCKRPNVPAKATG